MFEKWGLFKLARRTYSCLNSPDFGRRGLIASCFASVMKQFPAEISCKCEQMLAFAVRRSRDWLHDSVEAADLFKAAEDNAKWRYKSYLRMLSTQW